MNDNFRGYISSRPFMGERVPQHIQNLVIRTYCTQRKLNYLLSATEYAMDGCHIILNQIINELPELAGIAAYSLFQLPEDDGERTRIFSRVLEAGKVFHFCVEGLKLENEQDIERLENIWLVKKTLPGCPDLQVDDPGISR
jgi:sporadic carbohydrate cluster protein (TIGR04323 family)